MPKSLHLPLPSSELLKACFVYDQHTGSLVWKTRPLSHFRDVGYMKQWNGKYAGHEAGTFNGRYRQVDIHSRRYHVHRVIFKMMTNDDPPEYLDHRNGNGADNRWDNLRKATYHQNSCNVGMSTRNTSGFKGTYFQKAKNKFRAQIRSNGKEHHLGYFPTAIEAHQAYCAAAAELHGAFANVGA